ncbi:MAG: hypothetical protein J6D26_06350 [Clostridia bacterium]|nr:hypothetical protein [Clostridia bacterium]
MIKKFVSVIIIICTMFALISCGKDESENIVKTDKWNGTYVWTDENTEEFKIIDAKGIDDETVSFSLKSARETVEFEGSFKSASGRYIVVNMGPSCFKISLSTDGTKITVDDMWTDDKTQRTENWTAKYERLPDGEKAPEFGNPIWNGEYFCEELGQTITLYGIKEGFVLLTYDVTGGSEEETLSLKCLEYLEYDKTQAFFTLDERLLILDLVENNTRIKITDVYMNDSENKGISGVYTRKIKEDKNGEQK